MLTLNSQAILLHNPNPAIFVPKPNKVVFVPQCNLTVMVVLVATGVLFHHISRNAYQPALGRYYKRQPAVLFQALF